LGILIESSQVRLITNGEDLYTWAVLPEKKHLFAKNISSHSVGAYRELCEGIGITFEALPATTTRKCFADNSLAKVSSTNLCDPESQVSFSAKIAELQREVIRLTLELSQWREQADSALELKQHAEEELKELTRTNGRLQQDAQKQATIAQYFRHSNCKYVQGVNKILPLLEKLRTELPPVQGDCGESIDQVRY